MEILSRLAVKTLFQLKSVCRRWNEIIPSCPLLVSMHLRNDTNSPCRRSSIPSEALVSEVELSATGCPQTIMNPDPDGDPTQFRHLKLPECTIGDERSGQNACRGFARGAVRSDRNASWGYDVWFLNEQEWCWVKQFSIGPLNPLTRVVGYCDDSVMALFDPATKSTKMLLPYCDLPGGMFVYKDSLVSVSR